MNTTSLELNKIYDLAYNVLKKHGCDEFNADLVATTVTHAERDGSVSHGLFRIPGYVSSLKSKKVCSLELVKDKEKLSKKSEARK